ncbi:MAG: CPBP family intramembrane glutamic endopeptidase [Muribaculaceae bacterium]|nr:CPBP family intramembrane glutamic endopeptidase [Muribaculaceae bacterium]
MKKLLKQVGWLIAIIVGVAFMALIFTAIFQTAMEFFADRNGVVLSESVLYGISGTLGCGFAAIAICVIIRYAKRLRFYDCANPADSKWIAAFIVFTFAVCRIVLPGIWAYASSALGVQAAPVGNAPEESMWQMILFGVILSPVLEELLFRKDIFSLLKMRFSLSWTVWLSSLLFAAVHGYSVEGFVSCLVAGGLFAILMARTGKLLPCILAHVLCNLESLYYNTAKSGNALIVNLNEHTTYNVYIFAAGLLVMALSGVYLYRRNQHCK